MSAALLAMLGVGGGLVAWASSCERHRAGASRRAMLDQCAGLFDNVAMTIALDGFPRLSCTLGSHRLRISLIADTLAPKRLPQLWLVMSQQGPLQMPRLVVTARPRGDDFISAAGELRRQHEIPAWLPSDCAVRSYDGMAGLWLATLRAPLEAAFADSRVKEIALGPQGVRLVYQACEGRRGAHLLLRQARFETAIDQEVVQRCWSILRDIDDAARCDAHSEAA